MQKMKYRENILDCITYINTLDLGNVGIFCPTPPPTPKKKILGEGVELQSEENVGRVKFNIFSNPKEKLEITSKAVNYMNYEI